MTLAFTQLAHTWNARSSDPVLWSRRLFDNPWVWGAALLAVTLQLVVVYLPPVARAFDTRPLGPADWMVILTAVAVLLVGGQLPKGIRRRMRQTAADL